MHRAKLEEADWVDYFISFDANNRKEIVASLCRPRLILLDTVGVTIAESVPQPTRPSPIPYIPPNIDVNTVAPLHVAHFEWTGRFQGNALHLFRVAPVLYLAFEDSEGRPIRVEIPDFRNPSKVNQWPN